MHPFVCLACGKGFKYEHSLNFHIKSYHGLASSSSSTPSSLTTGSTNSPTTTTSSSSNTTTTRTTTSSPAASNPLSSINNHVVKTKGRSSSSSSLSLPLTVVPPVSSLSTINSLVKHEPGIIPRTGINNNNNNNDQEERTYSHVGDESGSLSEGQVSDDERNDMEINHNIYNHHLSKSMMTSSHHSLRDLRRSSSPPVSASDIFAINDLGFPGSNFLTKGIQIRSEKPLVSVLEGYHSQSDQTYVLYKCTLCGFAFPCLDPILAHIQSMHSSQSSFTCEKCGATFKWRSELQLHEQLHKAVDQQQQQQQVSSSAFSSIGAAVASSSTSSPPPAVKHNHNSPQQQLLMPSFLQPNLVLFNPFFDKRSSDAKNVVLNNNSPVGPGSIGINNNNSTNNNNGTAGSSNSGLIVSKNTLNCSGNHNNNNNTASASSSSSSSSHHRKSSSSSSSNGSSSHVNGHHSDTFSEQVLNLSKTATSSSSPNSEQNSNNKNSKSDAAVVDRKGRGFADHHHHLHHHSHIEQSSVSSPKRKHHPDGSQWDVKIEDRMGLIDESFHHQQQHQSSSSHHQQQQQQLHHQQTASSAATHHAIQMIPKVPSPLGEIEETSPGQFKCRYCDKTFDRIFSVHRHERVHTGYKPCICKVCGRGFSEKRNLRHHIIRFHSDGSGRELLKRARKDKSLAATTKQLAASVLKQATDHFASTDLRADSPASGFKHDQHLNSLSQVRHHNQHTLHQHSDHDLVTSAFRAAAAAAAVAASASPTPSGESQSNCENRPTSHSISQESRNGEDNERQSDDDNDHHHQHRQSPDRFDRSPSTAGQSGITSPPPRLSSSSSSRRRRKGMPSKKIVLSSNSVENSEAEDDNEDREEAALQVIEDEDGVEEFEYDHSIKGKVKRDDDEEDDGKSENNKRQRRDEDDYDEDEMMDEEREDIDCEDDENEDKRRTHCGHGSGSENGNSSENSLEGTISGGGPNSRSVRNHGAFFSSYSPRLGMVEKPIKRNEACRPLLGPDGKYLYPCGYCQKTFCSLSDLNRHMNFHEDVRPFKCQYCDYQSRTNSQLKVHMMRHAGIKQYLCQTCNYNGVTQSDLNRHCKTRSHILRSANVCPLCSLGFSTRILLQDHLDKFHESGSSPDSPPSPHHLIQTTPASTACDLSVKSSLLHRDIIPEDTSITA